MKLVHCRCSCLKGFSLLLRTAENCLKINPLDLFHSENFSQAIFVEHFLFLDKERRSNTYDCTFSGDYEILSLCPNCPLSSFSTYHFCTWMNQTGHLSQSYSCDHSSCGSTAVSKVMSLVKFLVFFFSLNQYKLHERCLPWANKANEGLLRNKPNHRRRVTGYVL